jgi:hypothetical protein
MHQLLVPSKKKKAAGKCGTPYCRNRRVPGRNFCNTCRGRKYDSPGRRLFRNLKASAKRRGKAFLLEFEEFFAMARASGYLGGSGRKGACLQVDRIDPLRGYEPGNIRFISCSENSRKAYVDRQLLRSAQFAAEELTPF